MVRRGLFLVALACIASPGFGASYIVPPDDVLVGKAQSIVLARATATWVEDSTERGIETVTELTVEDTLKGLIPHTFRIRIPGGSFGKFFKAVPGAPQFEVGAQELLFVNRRPGGLDYITTDFGLGHFTFRYDDSGLRLAVREDEISGWDLRTQEVHREQLRSAEKFIAYIRAIAVGHEADPDYFVTERPLHRNPQGSGATLHPAPQNCTFPSCTAVQYTLSFYTVGHAPCNVGDATTQDTCAEGGPQGRWIVFPSAVNFNRGNNETQAGGNGSDAINAAFAAWNGDALSNVNYVLASTTSNTNGIFEAPDGVNNIVFEKTVGTPYNCSTGGLLGVGGISATNGQHTFAGGMWLSISEGDVSMNTGVGACIGLSPGISVGNFNSAVTHEVGHTLGYRHADKSRSNNKQCITYTTYDCASSAIMTAIVTGGLNATLQTWDQHAVQTIYPASGPSTPTSVVATATTATNVQVTWSGSCSTACHVFRSSDHTTFTQIGAPTSSPYNDATAVAGTSYLYKVRSFNGTVESADSNFDMATTILFTTDPLVAGSTVVKPVHITELRTAVNAVRKLANNGVANDFSFTDPTLTPQTTIIKVAHVTDLRTALDSAMTTLGLPFGGYTDSTLVNVRIKAVHLQEIRNRVK